MRLTATILCIMLFLWISVAVLHSRDVDIYSTRLGDKILELAETRQLTTKADGKIVHALMSPSGKHVAYIGTIDIPEADDTLNRLCIVGSTGGRPAVILDEWQYLPIAQASHKGEPAVKIGDELLFLGEYPGSDLEIVWSPDGRLLAFPATQLVVTTVDPDDPDDIDGLESTWILVVNTSGARIASFPISTVDIKGDHRDHEMMLVLQDSLHWNRDCRRLAAAYYSSEGTGILVMDVTTGNTHRVVIPEEHGVRDLVGWSAVGGDLLYVAYGETVELRQVSVDGSRNVSLGEWKYDHLDKSPDGRFLSTSFQQEIENLSTGEKTPIPGSFLNWSPDGKLLSFEQTKPVDAGENRNAWLNMLWLAAPESIATDRICIAADHDEDIEPSWSSDSMNIAYVARGRLHTAELLLREASSTSEKIELGLPLSESEEQEVLVNNAKQIGTAIMMYNNDWDGQWPSSDTYAQSIDSYLRNNNILNRPGTEEMIFQYYPPPAGDYNPSETVMGVFDVGRGWRVVLYADGHVRRERN